MAVINHVWQGSGYHIALTTDALGNWTGLDIENTRPVVAEVAIGTNVAKISLPNGTYQVPFTAPIPAQNQFTKYLDIVHIPTGEWSVRIG